MISVYDATFRTENLKEKLKIRRNQDFRRWYHQPFWRRKDGCMQI